MPGSIHLPGWVGLLLERRRTGLRVESLTPRQSSVSAGIHCCKNPYHAKRNGVNCIWRPTTDRPQYSRPIEQSTAFRLRPCVRANTAPRSRTTYANRYGLSPAGDPKFRERAELAHAGRMVSAESSSRAPARSTAAPFPDCTPWQKLPRRLRSPRLSEQMLRGR